MADHAFELFDEYASAYARGERPVAEEYLARAAGEANELAGLIDGFLARAPVRAPTDDAIALSTAWLEDEPPLLALRKRRGVGRDEVVDVLIAALGLDRAKRAKV